MRQKAQTDSVQAKAILEQCLAGDRRAVANLSEGYTQKNEISSLAHQPARPGQFSLAAGSAANTIDLEFVGIVSIFMAAIVGQCLSLFRNAVETLSQDVIRLVSHS